MLNIKNYPSFALMFRWQNRSAHRPRFADPYSSPRGSAAFCMYYLYAALVFLAFSFLPFLSKFANTY